MPGVSGVGGLGERGEGIKKCKLVVTEQPIGVKIKDRECSQSYCDNCVVPGGALALLRGTLCEVYDCLTMKPYT